MLHVSCTFVLLLLRVFLQSFLPIVPTLLIPDQLPSLIFMSAKSFASTSVSFQFALFLLLVSSQARKRSTKINYLGPETPRWGGGLPCKGVVAEKFVLVPSFESLSSLGLEERNLGCPGNFAGMSRTLGGCSKSLC